MMVYFASFRNERTGEDFTDEMLCGSCFDELTCGATEDVFDWVKTGRTCRTTTSADEELIGEPCYLCEEEFYNDNA